MNVKGMDIYRILKKPDKEKKGVAVFSIVGNEMYFLPHFLNHYRKLDVACFYFIVDKSDDGTLEFLLEQDDCVVMESDFKFKDKLQFKANGYVIQGRFSGLCKHLVPSQLLMNRWVLFADADEFAVLPTTCKDLTEFSNKLKKNGLDSCRAPMIDFFPEKLEDLDSDAASRNTPFKNSPYFDVLYLEWKDKKTKPSVLNYKMTVRDRINKQLIKQFPDNTDLDSRAEQMLYKVPLIFFNEKTVVFNAHESTHKPTDQVQLALAHFKFYPGWKDKIESAVNEKQYALGSVHYKPLDLAKNFLLDWRLEGPWTRKLELLEDLEKYNLIYDELKN